MRISYAAAAIAVALMSGCQTPVQPRQTWVPSLQRPAAVQTPARRAEAPTQILVKFKPGMRANDLRAFRSAFGTRQVDYIAGIDVYVEEVTSRKPIDQVLAEINASPLVEYAELNGQIGIIG